MVSITDPEGFVPYVGSFDDVLRKYGGRFLASSGDAEYPEGFPADRTVIVEFPSYADALACYRSEEYSAALKLRRETSTAHFAIVEGL
ncbi:MAG: DUF1330 domain-containing protein [Rhizobiaceae bacterium]|nr:DUF1330 domain-containing protein [Rhizobiaceae bacterium]